MIQRTNSMGIILCDTWREKWWWWHERETTEKWCYCLHGLLLYRTGISTRMWPQEETVTQDERGNRVRNGQKMVTQQIISFLP